MRSCKAQFLYMYLEVPGKYNCFLIRSHLHHILKLILDIHMFMKNRSKTARIAQMNVMNPKKIL